jgi:DNA-binding response OmpR family regulator
VSAVTAVENAGASGRVLVVEDDESIAAALVRGLGRAGYDVEAVSTAAAALAADAVRAADVVLLDLGLPDADGLEVCRALRERGDAAIIVITARGEEPERVAALDAGADDYLVKPFGYAELLARMRAVLRRMQPSGREVVRHGRLVIDLRAHRVTVDGREVALTPKEFDILECLAADPGRVVTRQEIMERAWDAHWYGPTKVIDVHIVSLRRKLGDPALVETVYGTGFRLGDPR